MPLENFLKANYPKGHFKALLGRLYFDCILVGVHTPWKLDSVGFDIDLCKALATPHGGAVAGFVGILGEVDGFCVVCFEGFYHLVCEPASAVSRGDIGKAVANPGEGVDQRFTQDDLGRGETLWIPDPLVRSGKVEMMRCSASEVAVNFPAVEFCDFPILADNGDNQRSSEMLMATALAEDAQGGELLPDHGPFGSGFGWDLPPKGAVAKADLEFADYFLVVDLPLLQIFQRNLAVQEDLVVVLGNPHQHCGLVHVRRHRAGQEAAHFLVSAHVAVGEHLMGHGEGHSLGLHHEGVAVPATAAAKAVIEPPFGLFGELQGWGVVLMEGAFPRQVFAHAGQGDAPGADQVGEVGLLFDAGDVCGVDGHGEKSRKFEKIF